MQVRDAGMVMVLVRYMDDVMCALAYASEKEKYLAEKVITLLRNTYAYPLDLQWETRSDRYAFLEMEVCTSGDRLWCEYKSKFGTALMAGDLSYVRVPHGLDGHSTLDRFRYFRNTLIRICDCCTNPEDVYQSAVLAAMEMMQFKWEKIYCLYHPSSCGWSEIEKCRMLCLAKSKTNSGVVSTVVNRLVCYHPPYSDIYFALHFCRSQI